MKRLLTAILLLAAIVPATGQNKKALKAENEALKRELAALQARLDSLQAVYMDDSATDTDPAAIPGASSVIPSAAKESPELSDSLIDLWYKQRLNADFQEASEYDMDAVHFTSKVSDEELMRRLQAMNAYITIPFNETVKNYMILYSEKMPRHMQAMMGRSLYYFPIFEEKLAKYGLPLELKYMSIIESNLNPVAESRAGAMGIWQFMYRTGKLYGLKINSFMDERLDVEKSADAAARYLRDAYSVFGDWNLAICSYNCGSGNVVKAIKRADGKMDFWSIYPYLPRETRGYVPAFIGAMYAFHYAKEYGLQPADVGMPAAVDTFEIRRNLHFKQINEVVGVPLETVKLLNPQYTHDIIPGNSGTCILNLPYAWTGPFLAADQDSLYLHRAGELLNAQVLKNIEESGGETRITYKVKSGDYLGKIAQKNHCTVAQLKKWNHLRSDKLRIGQILYIYRR
ncbi:MAG: transglycosylase SLT domain-containing protein [Bacteroidales bacterium]|nr:transglycosylase SLT domain-containing protein [Bacteroidales bacterium]